MISKPIQSIPEYLSTILDIRDQWYPTDPYCELWYRGVNDMSLSLLPGAYWRSDLDENTLVLSFRNMVPPYIVREPTDDWEWYYLMQHYGLPTRLLDWTESPLVALYFALTDEATGKSPCVWVMDPGNLNKVAHRGEILIFVPIGTDTETKLNAWLPSRCGRGKTPLKFTPPSSFADNAKPIALFPKRNNPRIVAQRGVFTIHGCEEISIEELIMSAPDLADRKIYKIIIEPTKRELLLEDLWAFGINRTSLFPEPESVAKDLKRMYGIS